MSLAATYQKEVVTEWPEEFQEGQPLEKSMAICDSRVVFLKTAMQRRLWDPGIKSAFQDDTLRARWFRRSKECYALSLGEYHSLLCLGYVLRRTKKVVYVAWRLEQLTECQKYFKGQGTSSCTILFVTCLAYSKKIMMMMLMLADVSFSFEFCVFELSFDAARSGIVNL
ncbi:hypothetical protein Tco_0710260 [Tanacetum coccineum]